MSDLLATGESIARIVSLAAIPIAIAAGGWWIQRSLSEQSIRKDYVTLAVSILQKPEKDIPAELREWAADLLNDNSPTKFDSKTLAGLKSGEINLAAAAAAAVLHSEGGALAVSPDGKTFAIGRRDGAISLFDVGTGRTIRSFQGHSDAVASLVYSRDGQLLISGSFDKTARVWDIVTGALLRTLAGHTGPVIGVGVTPDGNTILTRSLDKTVKYWNRGDWKEIRTVQVGS